MSKARQISVLFRLTNSACLGVAAMALLLSGCRMSTSPNASVVTPMRYARSLGAVPSNSRQASLQAPDFTDLRTDVSGGRVTLTAKVHGKSAGELTQDWHLQVFYDVVPGGYAHQWDMLVTYRFHSWQLRQCLGGDDTPGTGGWGPAQCYATVEFDGRNLMVQVPAAYLGGSSGLLVLETYSGDGVYLADYLASFGPALAAR